MATVEWISVGGVLVRTSNIICVEKVRTSGCDDPYLTVVMIRGRDPIKLEDDLSYSVYERIKAALTGNS